MRLPTAQREAEPHPDDAGFRVSAQHALDRLLDSLSPAERAALRERRRHDDPLYKRRLGLAADRRRA